MNWGQGIRIAVVSAAVVAGIAAMKNGATPIDAASSLSAPQARGQAADAGGQSYAQKCAICHGDQREGNLPAFPPLTGIQRQMTDDKIAEVIQQGKGRMPGFPDVKDAELTALIHFLTSPEPSTQTNGTAGSASAVESGTVLFRQNCSFCHGRDAMGGETGPDLTQSKLVLADKTGEMIASVVREGRPAKKMPAFKFSAEETAGIVAFIRDRIAVAAAHPGGRRGVAVEDLQTGNVEAGRQYFIGAGGCAKCHSPEGDLAGVATRFEGLRLEMRLLHPWDTKSSVTVTLAGGKTISGTLAYLDEFTVALRDSDGVYHSWLTSRVRYKVDAPVEAHVDQLSKYTDDDIHNLMAYLQTLR